MWKVTQDGKTLKEYPHKEQCVIWCYEQKLVISGAWDFRPGEGFDRMLVGGVEIVEISDE